MKLELNLVKPFSKYDSAAGHSLDRRRYDIKDDSEFIEKVIEFIHENINTIKSVISDKDFAYKLENLNTLTSDELMGLKYHLSTQGLDLLFWCVSMDAVGEEVVDGDMIEYTVVDETLSMTDHLRMSERIQVDSSENSADKIFEELSNKLGLFEGPLFESFKNPIVTHSDTIRQLNELYAAVPPGELEVIHRIFNKLGKTIYILTA